MSDAQRQKTDIVIIGAGLSGLHTAAQLHQRGFDFRLYEARGRLGGRILSPWWSGSTTADGAAFDLGPAWFWPHQPRMHSLVDSLSLRSSVFEQWGQGRELAEDSQGRRHEGRFGVSMAGSLRLDGGLAALTSALAAKLPASKVVLGCRVKSLELNTDSITVSAVQDGLRVSIECNSVVVALPPRVAATLIRFEPALNAGRQKYLQNVSTWMAGHSKLVAIYDQPFWRSQGLSGDAFSQVGPLHEIHDASPRGESAGALFGFVGWPPAARESQEDLQSQAIAQLARLFGPEAARPRHTLISDWAREPFTATAADQHLRPEHSSAPFKDPLDPAWSERLVWSGSETASPNERNNGYLEGALEASERSVAALQAARQ